MIRQFDIFATGIMLLVVVFANAASADTISDDEAAIASNIKALHSEETGVREAAAKEIRRIIAKYPSGISNIRYKDGGEASWKENVDQVKPGMTEADVTKFLPVFAESPEISKSNGDSYLVFNRLDYDWWVGVPYRKPGVVSGKPTLFKGEMLVNVVPPENFSGTWETWYVNGQKANTFQIENSKWNGLMTHFDDKGRKSADQLYIDNVPEGLGNFWHPNGKIQRRLNYKKGKVEGRMIDWYDSGEKESDFGFKSGERDGVCIHWYKNGQKQLEMNYVNGVQDGVEAAWNEQGVLQYKREFKNGKVVPEQ